MIEKPIFITGAARSGTSLIAGIINKCGAWGGELQGPNNYNQKGMFENTVIRNKIVKPYIASIGYDPMCQEPLPVLSGLKPFDFKSPITKVIRRQGYKDGTWFLKGPKMCLIWPLWAQAFPEARWIIVRRRTEDIVDSCLRTRFMRAFTDREGWRKWVVEHKKRFNEMFNAGLDIHDVWPIKAIKGDFSEMKEVVADLGLTWNQSAVREFVSPELYHA